MADGTTGVVAERGGVDNTTAGMATARDTVVDGSSDFVAQTAVATDYGTFTLNVHGGWVYRLDDDNAAVQALNVGDTLHDLITVTTTGGTPHTIDITIEGANDAAVISGTAADRVREKSGVANGRPGAATASGNLNARDVDGAATFVAQTNVAGDYGTFSIDDTGSWTYRLDDDNGDVQALNLGDTLHERVTVETADGTSAVVDISIEGANDAAVISGTATGAVTEKGGVNNGTPGVATAAGDLNATDIDNAPTFVEQTDAATSYGTFSIDATGAWTYTLDDDNADVQALNRGGTLHDLVTVTTADGTAKVIDVTIRGARDTTMISGTATGAVTEKSGVANGTVGVATASGDLDASGGMTFAAMTNLARRYGTFSIDATGAWTYTLNDDKAAVQALNAGDTLHELVTVRTVDRVAQVIDITINGANDAAVITGRSTDRVREKGGVANASGGAATASGNLNARDVDSAATFVVRNVTGDYGSFSIDDTGAWTYTLDDANANVQALNVGNTRHERVTVATADGTSSVVDITIEGANDAAVITGTAAGSVTEATDGSPGVGSAAGSLSATDVDNSATFVAQTNVPLGYGTFSINSAGAWTYTLDNDNPDVDALAGGDTLHDTVTVKTADGTSRLIDITINGASDGRIDLTSLRPARGFIIQGDTVKDYAGWSVSSADVNGDGFADVIVGAPGGDDGGDFAGEAYVVFGKASGLGAVDGTGRAVIDLTDLAPAAGFVIQGDTAGDQAGWSVSSAGDVNGDGFDDLIVGAFRGDDGGDAAGEAYVVFGKASGFGTINGTGRAVIDLTTLAPANGFVVQGSSTLDYAGYCVSAGDVNGDGFADLMIGANRPGATYVVFGKASGFGSTVSGRSVIDLTDFTSLDGFIVQGSGLDSAGYSVSSAGDVNGDGFADLIIGATRDDDGGTDAGDAYVVFGRASGFGATINVATLAPARGFIIQGDEAGDQAGFSVSSAGDVNGDGFADIIVGARMGDDGADRAGEAYVVFGKASGLGTVDGTSRAVIDLTTLAPADGFIVQGAASRNYAGWSVSSAGDVNGDGFADLIVGAYGNSDGGFWAGAAYVIFGKASGFGAVDGTGRAVIDLASLNPANGLVIQGDEMLDTAGTSVSAAGDVNGDGFADLIVGARHGDDGGERAGEAYVLYGAAFGSSSTPVTTNGTSSAEILIGGRGDDTLSGGGGADSIRGGAGDDVLSVPDLAFRSIDGGGGSDTLVLLGADPDFDFTALANNKVTSIERIDITGSGDNGLTLGFADIAAMTVADNDVFAAANSRHALVIDGDVGDTLALRDYDPDGGGGVAAALWTQVATDVGLDGSAGGGYNVFDLTRGGTVLASVAMAADILQIT